MQATILPSWTRLTTHARRLTLALALALHQSLTAATYDAGPGQTYTNLAAVPWSTLAAGDTVNIHYQPGGYHEIVLLANSGVPGAPITINGVADPRHRRAAHPGRPKCRDGHEYALA